MNGCPLSDNQPNIGHLRDEFSRDLPYLFGKEAICSGFFRQIEKVIGPISHLIAVVYGDPWESVSKEQKKRTRKS
jgi:hypothetical protein